MSKTILLTGSTDGIGFEAAKTLTAQGHRVLLHGRNPDKLAKAVADLGGGLESFVADLSDMQATLDLAEAVKAKHSHLDVLVNNAGILKSPKVRTSDGFDIRFAVNTFAPFLLAKALLPLMPSDGRIINLSSAAQNPVDLAALAGTAPQQQDMPAYAQSKLAITQWSRHMADSLPQGPMVMSLNPGSLLATKMVKEGFGIAGSDIRIGADIIVAAAVSPDFAEASGRYYDNDAKGFGPPHPEADDPAKNAAVVAAIEAALADYQRA